MDPSPDFVSALRRGVSALELRLDDDAIERLWCHQRLLARWAPKINLVADPAPEVTVPTHFLDSLSLLRLVDGVASSWTDVGSGAGFPGAVLAAARPELRVRLVEPIAKRASFLQRLCAEGGLTNASVVLGRSDGLVSRSQPALVSRATLPPARWLEEAARLLEPGGLVVLMTARGLSDDELVILAELGFERVASDAYELPLVNAPRENILCRWLGAAAG